MKYLGFWLCVFGIIIIIFPEFLAILIGSFFVFLGVNILLMRTAFGSPFWKKSGKTWDDYVKFGKYKIYR